MVAEQTRNALVGRFAPEPGFPRPFGPFLLLCSFARGGMGEVFLAKTGGIAGIDKLCVLKTLRAELIEDKEYVNRFIDEARVVVQLSHVNVAQVFDVGRVGKEHYLAMEYVSGVTLRELADRARERAAAVTVETALYIGTEILEGLDYAHRRTHPETGELLGLVHRDVSPQNAMISFEGEVKLIDFGLARSSLKLEHSDNGVVMGKVAYMAPEQARGDELDARADQYAAAILTCEMVSGERFYGDMRTRDLWQVVGEGRHRPASFERIDRDLRVILERALAPEPEHRYDTCGELRDALLSFAASRSASANRRTLRELLRKLFESDIDESRSVVARYARVSAAEIRAATEATASHRIEIAKPPAAGQAVDGDTPSTSIGARRGVPAPVPSGKRYQETGLLAEGGMALVLKAVDDDGKCVVLKRVRPPYCFDAGFLRLFKDEGAVHALFDHPSIVKLLDCGEDDQGPFLVFEHVDGTDLGVVLERAQQAALPLDVEAALAVAIPLCEALAAAHGAHLTDGTKLDVVHRDVSPGNVLLSSDGEVKLADFGVASFALKSERTVAGEMKGKFAYMAPEQTRGEPVTPKTDLFAAGVLLFECLTASKLFDGPTDADVVNAVRTQPVRSLAEANPAVPAELSGLVASLLEKDPALRPASADEAARRLRAIAAGIGLDEGLSRHVARLARSAPRPLPDGASLPGRRRTYKVLTKEPDALVVAARPARPARSRARWAVALAGVIGVAGVGALVTTGPRTQVTQLPDAPPPTAAPGAATAPPAPAAPSPAATAPVHPPPASAAPSPAPGAPGQSTPAAAATAPRPPVAAVPAPAPTAKPRAKPAAALGAAAATIAAPVAAAAAAEPAGIGRLTLSSEPWAAVTIDGVYVKDTPLIGYALAAGRHKVVLKNPQYGTKEIWVDVPKDDVVKHRIDLLAP